jgi:AcrR family transcriptional regulator
MSVESPSTEALARRERKRQRTRLLLQDEALRLFAEKGYERTTVDEIAAAADVSARTFFRYFPTKEDVVLWDEYDDITSDLFASRPADEQPAESIRAIVREILRGLTSRDSERLLTRVRLLHSVPELWGRHHEQHAAGLDEVARLVAKRQGGSPDDPGLRAVAAAMAAAIDVAIDLWQKDGGKADLVELFDRTVEALVQGVGQLRAG